MRVVIADPIAETALETLKRHGFEVEDHSQTPKERLPEVVQDADVLVVRSATRVTKELIDSMKRMKLIVRGGVGLDNIDVAYARAKGIEVRNTPGASSNAVAELVFAHLFALARHIVRATVGIREGKWEKKVLKGFELRGKILGIIGLGRIGREVARIGQGIGMKVIGHDPLISEAPVPLVPLAELLARADVVTLHVPLTPETRHMIGEREFALMKEGAVLINCARGGVVDEKALLQALKSGKLAGAGLDVFEEEPPPPSELLSLPNVTLTPHIGAQTREAQARIGEEVARVILSFFGKTG